MKTTFKDLLKSNRLCCTHVVESNAMGWQVACGDTGTSLYVPRNRNTKDGIDLNPEYDEVLAYMNRRRCVSAIVRYLDGEDLSSKVERATQVYNVLNDKQRETLALTVESAMEKDAVLKALAELPENSKPKPRATGKKPKEVSDGS